MTNIARKHPIDVDSIEKGDYISPEYIEDVYGVKRDSKRYQFAVLKLRAYILDRTPYSVKQEQDGLRVLLDREASNYTSSRFRAGIHVMMKSFQRQSLVDRKMLTPQEASRHERRIEVSSRILTAVAQARRPLDWEPVKRNVPGLVKPMDEDDE